MGAFRGLGDGIRRLFGMKPPVGRDVTDAELHEILPRVKRERYAVGATIVRQDEPSDRFYVIADGEVEVFRERPDGERFGVAKLGRDDCFGEIGMITSLPRSATVRALTPVTVLAFDHVAFDALYGESDATREQFDTLLRTRLEQLLDKGLEH